MMHRVKLLSFWVISYQIQKRMHNSWLEEVRFSLESVQVLEKAIVSEMLSVEDNPKQKSIAQHRILNFTTMIQQKSRNILNFVKEEAAMKKEELATIEGQRGQQKKKSTQIMWQNFYEKAREIKDYHKKNQSSIPIEQAQNTLEFFRRNVFLPPFKEPEFTQEQNKGRYVDMHHIYLDYLNINKAMEEKQSMKLHDYLWFLQNLDKFDDFPLSKKMKHQHKYTNYLNSLISYLSSFIQRSRPLFKFQQFQNKITIAFQQKFDEGVLAGWQPQHDTNQDQSQWQYCSYCEKLFIKNNAYIEHLSGKNHKKYLKAKQNIDMDEPEIAAKLEEQEVVAKKQFKIRHTERKKQIALAEFKVIKMREEIANIIYDTMNLVRKKQTRGYEDADEYVDESSESEEADAPIYNPKNLPLGWDGKPIPYWLYKLHGLGIEYKCEICGNYSYWGRRAFEMHFQEWRHNYGMKCLKIPNTIHFKDVTSISDALKLHEKLIRESQQAEFRPDMEEEFEDNEGNILNKRTYMDMKKQGLIDI